MVSCELWSDSFCKDSTLVNHAIEMSRGIYVVVGILPETSSSHH